MLATILDLPVELLKLVGEYITHRPNFNRGEDIQYFSFLRGIKSTEEEVGNDTNWKSFLSTTKSFESFKKRNIYILLNKGYSKKYLKDFIFRFYIHHHLYDPKSQLGLRISSSDSSLLENISFSDNFSSSFIKIELTDIDIWNVVPNLFNVVNLTIEFADDTPEFPSLPNLLSLSLISCNFNSVEQCDSLLELTLYDCPEIKDLGFLCYSTKLKKVAIKRCSIERGFHCLKKIDEVWLSIGTVPNYSVLEETQKNVLESMNINNTSLLSLKIVSDLTLISCQSIIKIADLPLLKKVFVSKCSILTTIDFHSLPKLKNVIIQNCPKLKQVNTKSNQNVLIEFK
jgi:hypothetical protein